MHPNTTPHTLPYMHKPHTWMQPIGLVGPRVASGGVKERDERGARNAARVRRGRGRGRAGVAAWVRETAGPTADQRIALSHAKGTAHLQAYRSQLAGQVSAEFIVIETEMCRHAR